MKKLSIILTTVILLSCSGNHLPDASGSFEAVEVIISSEANGVIRSFTIEEGQQLSDNEFVGYVDTLQLYLNKKQAEAQIAALLSKKPDVAVQLASLKDELKTTETEQKRIENLFSGGAATQKQLDDIKAKVDVLTSQLEAHRSNLAKSTNSLDNEVAALMIRQEQINDQISKSKIVNPLKGTVLVKYTEANEMTAVGKPLYKIADLSEIILRAYITGNQLPKIKLNQQVTVRTDDGDRGFKETRGIITWISDKAEFTPKTIQTKNERANLVYAIKVKVVNDGTYKIGMYGEINLE